MNLWEAVLRPGNENAFCVPHSAVYQIVMPHGAARMI